MVHIDWQPAGDPGSETSGTLKIAGEATVESVNQIRDALLERLKSMDEVLLDCEQVTGIDFFAIQLFCSAHRSSAAWQKRLVLSEPLGEKLAGAMAATGFARHRGCKQCPEGERCLWLC